MILTIIEQIMLALPLMIGAYLSISLMKIPDLSIESAYLFGAVAAAITPDFESTFLLMTIPFAAAILGGSLVGLISSFTNQIFGVPFLLAAIVTNGLFHGIIQFSLGSSLLSLKKKFNPLDLINITGHSSEIGMLLLIGSGILILAALGIKSRLGYCFTIYGNNPSFFKHHGISTKYVVMTGIIIADAYAGLSGYLFSRSNGFVDLSMGYGVVLLSITSLMLGKIILRNIKPSILIPLVGLGIYFCLQQMLLRIGFDLKYFNAVQAVFILVGLVFFSNKFIQKQSTDHLGV